MTNFFPNYQYKKRQLREKGNCERMDSMTPFPLLSPQAVEVARYGAISGFIAVSALMVGVNYKTANIIFKEKTRTYWFIFGTGVIIGFLVLLYIFTIIFGKKLGIF